MNSAREFELQEAVSILRQTPATLRSLLVELPERWVESSGDRSNWHPYDILGHLIHGERADWIPRARIILEQGTERAFDPFDREAMFDASRGKDLDTLLTEFGALRKSNLEILDSWHLSESDFEKEGIHPDFGPVTLGQLLSTWAVHDLNHIFQITRVIARNYREEVGPWIKHLAVLQA
jgi:hypothetical protein